MGPGVFYGTARLALFGTAPVPAPMETKVSSEVKPKPGRDRWGYGIEIFRWEEMGPFSKKVLQCYPLIRADIPEIYGILWGS